MTMNTLVGNNGIIGNEYRLPPLIFGNFVTRNMNTTNIGLRPVFSGLVTN